ncbi:MAG: hypothetical protein GWP05_03060 [Anaerolineaceae bacterium]|nr:hypothetical protein [Anaerolineaceae bacterium]
MTLMAIVLCLLAAAMHAGWNLLGKRHHPSVGFFMVSLAVGVAMLATVSWRWWWAVPGFPAEVWWMLLATSACQGFYFVSLSGAYRHGHMSVAYPLARSLPALAVPALTYWLGQGKPVTLLCVAGIALIVLGAITLPMRRLGELRLKNYLNISSAFAVLAAVGITGFSVIDDRALRVLRADQGLGLSKMASALSYFQFEMLGTVLFLAPYVFLRRRGRQAVGEVVRTKRPVIVLTAFGLAATYSLVLTAMGYADNVSYVYAFIQLGIPLGALAGMLILREPRFAAKYVGVALILAGTVLVALG